MPVNDSRKNIMLLPGGLASLVLGIGGLLHGASGTLLSLCIILNILGVLEVCVWLLLLYRDRKNAPRLLSEQERLQGTEFPLDLPWSQLDERFHQLAARDDSVGVDDPPGLLVWTEYAPLAIYHTGGEDWLALHWVNIHNSLSDDELATLCSRHALPMQETYRGQNAAGVAFYREGKLTLYPAAFEAEFRRCFLERALAPEAEFQQWAAEYYDEEGRVQNAPPRLRSRVKSCAEKH